MPVQTPHADYSFRKPDWDKLRTFAEGARAVRAAGVTFLPKLTGQTDEEYAAYRSRAEVYGAIDRTIDGLEGAIFLKAPKVTVPKGESTDALLKDCDLSGHTLVEWIRSQVTEILTVARSGVLIEHTPNNSLENRPYLVSYGAERIYNWETEMIKGVPVLTLVVLEEIVSEPSPSDPFVKLRVRQFRVLRLVDGRYIVERWRKKLNQTDKSPGAAEEFEKIDEVVPIRSGQALDRIPFFFLGAKGQSITPEKPPLLDVAELCVLHYLNSADYQHGLHWVGLPTPVITGVRDKDTLTVGPSKAIVLEDPQAKAYMLEFTGAGLSALKDRLADLERKMAILGARILEEQKRTVEAAETVKLRQGGDISTLSAISDAVSRGVEAVVTRMLWWAGIDNADVTVELNMDFQVSRLSPQELTALLQTWQAGGMSKTSFLSNLKRGDMLPEDTSVEDELALLETETPPNMGTGTGGAVGGKAA